MPGLICYFDILGYQNFLKNNSAEKSINKVFNIITSIPDLISKLSENWIKELEQTEYLSLLEKKYLAEFKHNLKHLVFSDTIVLTLPLPSFHLHSNTIKIFHVGLYHIKLCASVLMEEMHSQGLPVRGVIHEGEFFLKDSCLAGSGIVEAYQLCEELNFSGLVCTQSLSNTLLERFKLHKPIINNDGAALLFTYPTPLKNGSEIKLVLVNWMEVILAVKEDSHYFDECRKDIEYYVLKSFWAHLKDCPNLVDLKVHNTVKLIRKMLLNVDLRNNSEIQDDNINKDLNITHQLSHEEHTIKADKFFQKIFEWVRSKGFINTNLKHLMKIQRTEDWFIFLGNTNDFKLITRNEAKYEELALVSLTSNKGIIVEPECRPDFEAILKEFEENYQSFTYLSLSNQEEIIKKYIKKK
ncbi:hypothetical protein [Nitrosomonas ureae]|uniref:Guanylate cyclase domain-containing protein n=1 Tax=Nitrosomonas ureae TaxID=44577 RepID=A0A286AL00_9PROT|nr:hypothetical protein [Nitrosomonas ureae]SOD22588.1 hypothetical protein SAMN06297164_3519 [Nitrosomonas ureae]